MGDAQVGGHFAPPAARCSRYSASSASTPTARAPNLYIEVKAADHVLGFGQAALHAPVGGGTVWGHLARGTNA